MPGSGPQAGQRERVPAARRDRHLQASAGRRPRARPGGARPTPVTGRPVGRPGPAGPARAAPAATPAAGSARSPARCPRSGPAGRRWPPASAPPRRAVATWPASRTGSSSEASRLTQPTGRSPVAAHCRSAVVLPYPAGAASTISGAWPATASRRASSWRRRTMPRRSSGVPRAGCRGHRRMRGRARRPRGLPSLGLPSPGEMRSALVDPWQSVNDQLLNRARAGPGNITSRKLCLSTLFAERLNVVIFVRRVAKSTRSARAVTEDHPGQDDEHTHPTSTQSSRRTTVDVRERRGHRWSGTLRNVGIARAGGRPVDAVQARSARGRPRASWPGRG